MTTNIDYHPRLRALAAPDSPGAGHPLGDILRINGFPYVDSRHVLVAPGISTYVPFTDGTEDQPIIEPVLSILHTQASSGRASNAASYNWANRPEVTGDAHFYGPTMDDGLIWVCQPLNRRTDSSKAANSFMRGTKRCGAVQWETQDNGGATINKTPWTLPQIDMLVKCLTTIHFTYRMWCTLVSDPLGNGIGYHYLFANDPQHPWSATGHTCPGQARIAQIPFIINAVAANLAKLYSDVGESCPS